MDHAGSCYRIIRVGCAGWSISKQSAAHFPASGSHLARYSARFNCCEINSSFYGPHKPETWERWAASVPEGFQFSVKAPRAITHEAQLICGVESLSPFLRQITLLGAKLGPVLLQLPPSLQFDEDRAGSFLSLFRQMYSGSIVVEPRHSRWFDEKVNCLLEEFRVGRVAADPACVPPAAHPGGWAQLAYFRLHGSPRRYYSEYSTDRLDRLSGQLLNLVHTTQVWCVFDNTAAGHAIENALALQSNIASAIATPPFRQPSKLD